MSDKRKKRKFAAKRESRRRKELDEAGRLTVDGVELPKGAVLADLSQQAPNNSYSPPLCYVDRPYTCRDCGREEVWTASQQKWYYEVAKGPIYATAVRCAECRRRAMEARDDPYPNNSWTGVLRRVRPLLEPALAQAGFTFDRRNRPRGVQPRWLDYQRSDMLLRILCDPLSGHLIAECLEEEAEHRMVADANLITHTGSEMLQRLEAFAEEVTAYLNSLPRGDSGDA